ncbi:MAG: DUF5655 domain-containing protein [Anaerolineales bacterium]
MANIQKKTGCSLKRVSRARQKEPTGPKHGELRDMFKEKLDLGHGDANTLVHEILKSDGAHMAEGKSADAVLDEIYTGAKAAQRPIHEALMQHISKFGEFEIAPKKGYVSLRRKKQFAMIGPKTNTRFEVGINAKDFKKNKRLQEQQSGSMCNYIVALTDAKEVDAELIAWIKSAYDGAG